MCTLIFKGNEFLSHPGQSQIEEVLGERFKHIFPDLQRKQVRVPYSYARSYFTISPSLFKPKEKGALS